MCLVTNHDCANCWVKRETTYRHSWYAEPCRNGSCLLRFYQCFDSFSIIRFAVLSDCLLGTHHRSASFSQTYFISQQHKMEIRSHLAQSLIHAIVFLFQFNLAEGLPDAFCDRSRYGIPSKSNCYQALARFPIERYTQYFVEEQLRSAPPNMEYKGFRDARAPAIREPLAHTPKLMFYGTFF